MSAKGLVEADYFPRVGKYRYPDSWVKISTFREENERIGLSPEFVTYALAHGDEATRQKVYRATEEHTAVMTTQMEEDILSNLEKEDEVAEVRTSLLSSLSLSLSLPLSPSPSPQAKRSTA